MNNWAALLIFTMLYNHHHYLFTKLFQLYFNNTGGKKTLVINTQIKVLYCNNNCAASSPYLPIPGQTLVLTLRLCELSSHKEFAINDIMYISLPLATYFQVPQHFRGSSTTDNFFNLYLHI